MIILNETFEDLIVIEKAGLNSNRQSLVKVKCKICGREKISNFRSIRKLVGTSHKACGQFIKRKDMHFYNMWADMRKRTTNKNHKDYKYYGGRGINSEDFKYFIDFYDYFYQTYIEYLKFNTTKEATLDRIDVNKNYEKGNIRLLNREKQMRNTRKFLEKKIKIINLKTNEEEIFDCITDINKKYNNFSIMGMWCVLNKKTKTSVFKNYHFEYINKCVTNIGDSQVANGVTPTAKDQDLVI